MSARSLRVAPRPALNSASKAIRTQARLRLIRSGDSDLVMMPHSPQTAGWCIVSLSSPAPR